MEILNCSICGVEFEAPNKMHKVCNDCSLSCFKSLRQDDKRRTDNNKPNQRLIDEVKAATKAGLSYGNYKGRAK